MQEVNIPKEGLQKKEIKKKKTEKNIPLSWFFLTILIAVILSFLISLILINVVQADSGGYSADTGTIIVHIQPELNSDSGNIQVKIKGEGVNITDES